MDEDRGNTVRVPVAKDGTFFSPECRRKRGYQIGPKGSEQWVADYWRALEELKTMKPPKWRRPSAASGRPGIVTGVRCIEKSRNELLCLIDLRLLTGTSCMTAVSAAFPHRPNEHPVHTSFTLGNTPLAVRPSFCTIRHADSITAVTSGWRRIEWQFDVQFGRKRRWRLSDTSLPSVYESGAHHQRCRTHRKTYSVSATVRMGFPDTESGNAGRQVLHGGRRWPPRPRYNL